MTDTEAKALALELDRIANQLYAADPTPIIVKAVLYIHSTIGAEARHAAELREQAERFDAFRQEVSEACKKWTKANVNCRESHDLDRFILPKSDPLVEVCREIGLAPYRPDELHAALAARGGRIVWGDDQ